MTETNPVVFLIWSYWQWIKKIYNGYRPKEVTGHVDNDSNGRVL